MNWLLRLFHNNYSLREQRGKIVLLKLPVAINVENISTLYKYQLNQNYNIENEAIFSYFCINKIV